MKFLKVLFFFCLCGFYLTGFVFSQEFNWQEIKGKHFIVLYQSKNDKPESKRISRLAEKHYGSIGRKIGYIRYSNFWTWDDRVKIILFPNRKIFLDQTGNPEWARGGALDIGFSGQKVIVSYAGQSQFLNEVLPHEISHLVLYDFIGFDYKIPIWFSEGVAQLAEVGKAKKADLVMRLMIRLNRYYPIDSLDRIDIRKEKNVEYVELFYAESVSIVNFLIKKFGSDMFGRLCRKMGDGSSFEVAMKFVYQDMFSSYSDLEKKWIQYLNH